MKQYLTVILLLSGFIAGAQKSKKVFVEGGTVINQPVQKSIKYELGPGMQGGSAGYVCYGYYFKAGIDLALLKYRMFSLELPLGFSYKNVNSRYWSGGYSKGEAHIAGPYYYNVTSKANVQSIDFSFGVQPRVDLKRFSIGGNLMFNTFMNCKEKEEFNFHNFDNYGARNSGLRNLGVYVACSSGLEGLYSLNNKLAFGPKCDLFFMALGDNSNWKSLSPMGPARAVWINPGVKMSYSLSNKTK